MRISNLQAVGCEDSQRRAAARLSRPSLLSGTRLCILAVPW